MRLDRITFTGVDDTVEPGQLIALSREFPFIEWGVLMRAGTPRGRLFPTITWIRTLMKELHARDDGRAVHKFALHLCDGWVSGIMQGRTEPLLTVLDLLGEDWLRWFQRVQLNFHGLPCYPNNEEVRTGAISKAAALLCRALPRQQIITQQDGTLNELLVFALRAEGVNAVPLFDRSGGAGQSPDEWPSVYTGVEYHGFAGGLGPDNVDIELRDRISKKVNAHSLVWIDMEHKLRSGHAFTDEGTRFDLDKVRTVIARSTPFIAPSA